ncbi:hypothetical protein GCM10023084_37290 [Streptomyces lacrimifluminis]|uniref:Membrane transport protein MMPL domain-containing protein n=1 Tax=Streptomyces lacrimifluminis TaxID=1500077 RepID=A0A917NY98_9ACTN|nr:hypothetical protein GCM10012282_36660 [Streptomyces lacrimifluminis]
MATFLYRLGRLAFRRRRIVVMLWVAVLAAIGVGAMSAPGTSSGALSVPDTQSQRAIDLLQEEFPQAAADGATARVVFEAPSGQRLTSANKAAVESLVAKLEKSPQVSGVSVPSPAAWSANPAPSPTPRCPTRSLRPTSAARPTPSSPRSWPRARRPA